MRRSTSILRVALPVLAVLTALPVAANAIIHDGDICFGTGLECVINTKIVVNDPQGVDVSPLTLRIKAPGALIASEGAPLTIKAGQIIVEKGGAITGTVSGGQGNTLNLIADAVTIAGILDVSSVRVNSTGGDGGSLSVTATGACTIGGTTRANGTRSTSIGGNGGDINFDCGSIDVVTGALLEVNASGSGAVGGNISLNADTELAIEKGAVLHAFGAALDGGSVSLSTDGSNVNAPCTIAGKLMVDAKVVSNVGGAGGAIDVACGGDVTIDQGALFTLTGIDGGGSVDIFSGGDFTMAPKSGIKANSLGATGGTVDVTAAVDATVGGKIEARSGGLFGNDGEISVTNGRDMRITKGATINASAGRKDQQAGQIILAGGVGIGTPPLLTIEQGALLKATGHGSGFGSVDVDISGTDCTQAGTILADGQLENGVAVGFVCDTFTLAQTGVIQVNSKAGDPSGTLAGTVTIDTTGEESGGSAGACIIDGKIILKAASSTFTDSVTKAKYLAPGHGGTFSATCGLGASMGDRGLIDVSAGGPQSVGGQVTMSANQPAHISGTIKAKAGGTLSAGGRIAVAAPDVYLDAVPGVLDASASSGGTIELSATDGTAGAGLLSIGKAVNAQGGSFGGNVVAHGCNVTIGPLGWLRADGSKQLNTGGINQVNAQNELTVMGRMTALNGQNLLVYGTSLTPALSGTIKPTALRDPSLSPCP